MAEPWAAQPDKVAVAVDHKPRRVLDMAVPAVVAAHADAPVALALPFGYGGNYHRVAEYNGYTRFSPAC